MPHKQITVDGIEYPSVTTVLKTIANPGLDKWRDAVGHRVADLIAKKAADFGTQFHLHAARWLTNPKSRCRDKKVSALLVGFKEWYRSSGLEPIEIEPEEPYVSRLLRYHGSFDLVAKHDEKVVIIDWKTSNRIHKSYGLQLSAYANLYEEVRGIKIEEGWIVRIDKKTGKIEVKKYGRLSRRFSFFKKYLDRWWRLHAEQQSSIRPGLPAERVVSNTSWPWQQSPIS